MNILSKSMGCVYQLWDVYALHTVLYSSTGSTCQQETKLNVRQLLYDILMFVSSAFKTYVLPVKTGDNNFWELLTSCLQITNHVGYRGSIHDIVDAPIW